jgi:acyl-coenzyme A thioesterase PaaI-like protein
MASIKRARRSLRRFLRRLRVRLINFYPPYLGAGVWVWRRRTVPISFDVWLPLRWWNKNYVGSHFGGSLYSMCDPFYMLILLDALGPEYIVWDKASSIRFLRPARGRVRAHFEVSKERVEEIRRQVATQGVVEPLFTAHIRDRKGRIVAEVTKLLYVRSKNPRPLEDLGEDEISEESSP